MKTPGSWLITVLIGTLLIGGKLNIGARSTTGMQAGSYRPGISRPNPTCTDLARSLARSHILLMDTLKMPAIAASGRCRCRTRAPQGFKKKNEIVSKCHVLIYSFIFVCFFCLCICRRRRNSCIGLRLSLYITPKRDSSRYRYRYSGLPKDKPANQLDRECMQLS